MLNLLSRNPTLYVVLSAFFWGLFPVFSALTTATDVNNGPIFSFFLNLVGALACFLIIGGVYIVRGFSKPNLLLFSITNTKSLRLFILDGFFIAVSNTTLFMAVFYGNPISIAVIVESWPILVAVLLPIMIADFRVYSGNAALVAVLGVSGYFLMQFSKIEEMFVVGLGLLSFCLAIISALTQAGTVSVNQKIVYYWNNPLSLREVLPLQSVRMLVASFFSLCFAALIWIYDPTGKFVSFDNMSGRDFWLNSAMAGALIAFSAMFYTLGLNASKNPLANLAWFFTPVFTSLILFYLGLDSISSDMALGILFVMSALMVNLQKKELSVPFYSIVLSVLGLTLIIQNFKGLQWSDYFRYIEVVGLLYSLLQGFTLSRLWQRKMEMASAYLNAESMKYEEPGHGESTETNIGNQHQFRKYRQLVRLIREETRRFSEVLVIAILGISLVGILVFGRPSSFRGDVVAFLVSLSVLYLVALTWDLVREISIFPVGRHKKFDRSGDTIISYAFCAFAIIVAMYIFWTAN